MNNLIKEFLSKKTFAVVGSFKNEQKVAYRIFKNLRSRGYEVYPVNPNIKEVDGVRCYSSIKDLPVVVDVVNFVTPPKVSLEIVKQCLEKRINMIWLQPGAESEEVINFCKQHNIKVIHNICIMMTN